MSQMHWDTVESTKEMTPAGGWVTGTLIQKLSCIHACILLPTFPLMKFSSQSELL